MPNKRYPLIIFDWDGTIIDSQAHIIDSMCKAISDQGLEPPAEDSIRHIIGLSLDGAIRALLPEQSSESVQFMADRYRHHFFNTTLEPSRLFDGVEDIVRQLHKDGYLLAVATGKGRHGLDMALRTTGLKQYIHVSRCADETRSKPDPMMLGEILTDLDMPVNQAVMVGDTSYDLDMAANIKMDSIAVTYGMHARSLLEKHRPTHIIDSIAQLTHIV
jgi:phosphoglycolate phosphatase